MSAWLISLEGTEAGRALASFLALAAAFLHAVFGALRKGRHDPWLSRGVIDAACALMAAPVTLHRAMARVAADPFTFLA